MQQVLSSGTVKLLQVAKAGRRDRAGETRSRMLRVEPVMRQVTELCHDSLVQPFLLPVKGPELAIMTAGSPFHHDWGRDWLRPAQSQNPSVRQRSVRLRMWSFF